MEWLFIILLALTITTAIGTPSKTIALFGYAIYHLNRMSEEDFDERNR